MADNDFFRIRVGDTGADTGYVSFDIADNGNEPIYFRQYQVTNEAFGTLVHQVTLLDGSGNTSFPGTVSAPTFSGHLVGTADNATTTSSLINVGLIPQISSGRLASGLSLSSVYVNGWPIAYGNVLNIGGPSNHDAAGSSSGDGQLLCGWSGSETGG